MPYADITKPPAPLPTPRLQNIGVGISLLPPLSRRGHGPGLIILVSDLAKDVDIVEGVPSAFLKWAEEGYTVVQIKESTLRSSPPQDALSQAVAALSTSNDCQPKDKIGLVAYEPTLWNLAASALSQHPSIVGAAIYSNAFEKDVLESTNISILRHFAGEQQPEDSLRRGDSSDGVTDYYYPVAKSYKFATPFHEHFHYNTESMSHTRSLTHLKRLMGGPYFDLEAIWEEHTYYEFADRSVEHTMSTMVQEPYVNHIPTMTGGVGRSNLTNFYRHNFIFNNSADTELELISRTLGIDRVVDEFIFKFTHDTQIDWLLPGVPPTNLKAQVPFTAIINIRGDRLYHEHISWDQGTLLAQLGLLPEYLPYPYPLPGEKTVLPGRSFEYRVPVAAAQTAHKLRDRNSAPSNEMFKFAIREKQPPASSE